MAPRDAIAGIPYGRQLVDGIRETRLVLLIFSRNANNSEHVLRELELAADGNKTVIPFRIEDVLPSGELEYYIKRVHWLDAFKPPIEARIDELVAQVQRLLLDFEKHLADEMVAEPMRETIEDNERIKLGEVVLEPNEARAAKNNLPLQLTSFVGRETELSEIGTLLSQHRLVTLTGSAGGGKTRTSLQVAAPLLDDFSDGVWFVELAPLTSSEYIPSTTARAVGMMLGSEGDPIENLVRQLKAQRALLIFDNCEHLVGPAGRVIAAILRDCPKITVLASSRQALGIAGEEAYDIPPLGFRVKDDAAIALFVDRARAVDKRFALDDENAPTIVEICRRLDGIPLAIELAASRVKILSPRQLRERLDERFRVLTSGSRDVLPRQQTLRATIDWSHDLLDERERTLFRRLSVFVSGFTLEGAVAVGSGAGLDELDVFDVLASLVDKSLVLAERDGDALRYRLLESTRVYASEKLDATGERENLASRHLRYLRDRFTELLARVERTGRQTELAEALRTELEDVRSALDGAPARSEVIEGGELLATIELTWGAVGLTAEGIGRCERYLAALPSGESRLLARLLTPLSFLLWRSGQKTRAVEAATEAVAYARESADRLTLAWALQAYACAARLTYRRRAEAALAEAEAIPDISANFRLELLRARALLTLVHGDPETASHMWEQLHKEHRSLGNTHDQLVAALNLAEVEHARGQTLRAITIARETLPMVRSGTPIAGLHNFAGYLAAVDDLPGASAAARIAIGFNASLEADHAYVAVAIEHLALVFALRGDLARAATLEGYADASFARHGFEREFTETTTYDRLTALLREGLSPGELARVTTEGAALSPEAAVALALEAP